MTKEENDEARMTNDERMTKSENAPDYEGLFWNNDETSVVCEEPGEKRVYDLEERTARFGEAIIDFAKTIPQSAVTYRIVGQLVGAATSVGANYVEADDAVSKKEFLKNIGTCRKEARETKHFLQMAVCAVPELKPQARKLWVEAKELHLIFSAIGETGNDLLHSSFVIVSSFDIFRMPATCRKEARETKHSLRMTVRAVPKPFIRASSFFRHSSFVIRHFPHA